MSYWYPLLKDLTIESSSYRVNEELLAKFRESFFKAIEGDPFKIAKKILSENLDLWKFIADHIARWGGVFIRADKASPKDSCVDMIYSLRNPFKCGIAPLPETQYNACIALSPEAALALIISSERVLTIGDPSILWVREPTRMRSEYRVFVKDLKPRLISWYYIEEPNRFCEAIITNRIDDVYCLIDKVHERTGLKDFVLDVGFVKGKIIIVELTPFPEKENPWLVDPLLFREDFWEKLGEAMEKNKTIIRYTVAKQEINEQVIE